MIDSQKTFFSPWKEDSEGEANLLVVEVNPEMKDRWKPIMIESWMFFFGDDGNSRDHNFGVPLFSISCMQMDRSTENNWSN